MLIQLSYLIPHLVYAQTMQWQEESYGFVFFLMGLLVVVLGQGTFNALVMLAIKHYYFKEDVESWRVSIFSSFILCVLVYMAVVLIYWILRPSQSGTLSMIVFTGSILLYLLGQGYAIYYGIRRAMRHED
jgi:hypothetical protein